MAVEGLETPLQRNQETYGEEHILQGEDLPPCSTEEIREGNFRAFGFVDPKQGEAGSCLLQNRVGFRGSWWQITSHRALENWLFYFWTLACF